MLFFCLSGLALAGCVSTKEHNALRADMMRLRGELDTERARTEQLTGDNGRLGSQISDLEGRAEEMKRQIADLERRRDELTAAHEALNARYNALAGSTSQEAARMVAELEKSRLELDENRRQLEERSARVEELEHLLRLREEAIVDIRRKVTDALLGFEGKGLSITTRNGNVYVSMEDKLLFRSGSFEIDPRGAEAVRDLAVVLEQNPDINIMVEGHTDDVPYRPNGHLADNLDLSAKRATTVTRLLLGNSTIAPARIISAARGEYLPVAEGTSAEARARNRRTEIILSPKLDELMRILDN